MGLSVLLFVLFSGHMVAAPSEDALRRAQCSSHCRKNPPPRTQRRSLLRRPSQPFATHGRSVTRRISSPVGLTDYKGPQGYRETIESRITVDLMNIPSRKHCDILEPFPGGDSSRWVASSSWKTIGWIEEDWIWPRETGITEKALSRLKLKTRFRWHCHPRSFSPVWSRSSKTGQSWVWSKSGSRLVCHRTSSGTRTDRGHSFSFSTRIPNNEIAAFEMGPRAIA